MNDYIHVSKNILPYLKSDCNPTAEPEERHATPEVLEQRLRECWCLATTNGIRRCIMTSIPLIA